MVGLILGNQKIKRRGHVIMARTRKTSREKLQEKLEEITEAMAKYEEGLEKLKAEKKECEKELHNLELQELLGLMSEKKYVSGRCKTSNWRYRPLINKCTKKKHCCWRCFFFMLYFSV